MNIRSVILGTGVAAATLLAATAFAPALAGAATGLTIQPVKISETLKPSETVSGFILLTNASNDDVQVDIAVQDFVPTSGTETFQFIGRAPGVTTVRDWITLKGPSSFTFKRGESKQVAYSINAPADAEPGSHFGVVFFKATRVSDLASQIKVGTQVGVLVFVTVPGKFEQKGTVTDFKAPTFVQGGPVQFSMSFLNTGTVYFEPKGSIDVFNMFGSKVASVPIQGYAVLPTGLKVMSFPWNVTGFLLGRYRATASVFDADNNLIASKSVAFYALPIWYIIGFIIILVILYFLIRFIRTKLNISVSLK